MTDTPDNRKPGLVAEKPEHCFACYRLIRPGEIRHRVKALVEAGTSLADSSSRSGKEAKTS